MSTAADPHRIVAGAQFGWQPEALPFSTIPELFVQRVAELGDKPMMRQKDLGIWRGYSWNQVATIVREIASICCGPPDRSPASCVARSRRIGK